MSKKYDIDSIIENLKNADKYFKELTMQEAWACFKQQNRFERCKVTSSRYEQRVQGFCKEEYGYYIGRDAVKQICFGLEAFTMNECAEQETKVRLTLQDGSIFYDLGNDKGEVVQISPNDVDIVDNSSIPFRNPMKQKPQVKPIINSKIPLKSIKDFINISDENIFLFIVYIIACFIPDIEHPILELCGGAGQGKSTISSIIRDLFDPSHAESISIATMNADNFYLSLYDSPLTVFENESSLSKKESDNLCRAVTGSAIEKRKLYTDGDTIIIRIKGRIVINCIKNILREPDVIDRSLIFPVKQKVEDSYKIHGDLLKEFSKRKPHYLGKIFKTISKAMGIYESMEYTPISRMAEFERWGVAIATALGQKELFLSQYKKMLANKLDETTSNNTLLTAIDYLLGSRPDYTWAGRMSDLLREIIRIADSNMLDQRDETMPRGSEQLAKMLNSYEHLLKAKGITIIRNKRTNQGSNITIKKVHI